MATVYLVLSVWVYVSLFAIYDWVLRPPTCRNCVTVVSMIISGRRIKWMTPFFTGILALTISDRTTPSGCLASPTIVLDLTYTARE